MTTLPFDQLLSRHSGRALRAALGFVRDEQEARDITQDALTKALRAQDRYDVDRPFYPWLYRIVKTTSLDAIARRKRRAINGLDAERISSDAHPADERLDHAQELHQLRLALDALRPDQQEVLNLRHFQDLSYAEIADLLGVPQGTVMSRLFRARRALAARMPPREAP